MARRKRFSEEPFGPTVERLMAEAGVTYRELADQDEALRRLPQPSRPRQPAGARRTTSSTTLAEALGVEAEHFREYRLRVITDRLEAMPELIDRLYKRLES